MIKIKNFVFSAEWYDIISKVEGDEAQLALLRALICRQLGRRVPKMKRAHRILFQALLEYPITEAAEAEQKSRFEPPSISEVENFIKEHNLVGVDAYKWWNFYNSKGWYVGKTKMKNWKSAVRTWERSANNNPANTSYAAISKQAGANAARATLREIFGEP